MTLYDTCAAGLCTDHRCAMHGCMKRQYQQPVYTAPPQGCICPLTSEQTCLNDRCPRKPWKSPMMSVRKPQEVSDE